MTVAEVAARLNLTKSGVRRACDRGALPCTRDAEGNRDIAEVDVERFASSVGARRGAGRGRASRRQASSTRAEERPRWNPPPPSGGGQDAGAASSTGAGEDTVDLVAPATDAVELDAERLDSEEWPRPGEPLQPWGESDGTWPPRRELYEPAAAQVSPPTPIVDVGAWRAARIAAVVAEVAWGLSAFGCPPEAVWEGCQAAWATLVAMPDAVLGGPWAPWAAGAAAMSATPSTDVSALSEVFGWA